MIASSSWLVAAVIVRRLGRMTRQSPSWLWKAIPTNQPDLPSDFKNRPCTIRLLFAQEALGGCYSITQADSWINRTAIRMATEIHESLIMPVAANTPRESTSKIMFWIPERLPRSCLLSSVFDIGRGYRQWVSINYSSMQGNLLGAVWNNNRFFRLFDPSISLPQKQASIINIGNKCTPSEKCWISMDTSAAIKAKPTTIATPPVNVLSLLFRWGSFVFIIKLGIQIPSTRISVYFSVYYTTKLPEVTGFLLC